MRNFLRVVLTGVFLAGFIVSVSAAEQWDPSIPGSTVAADLDVVLSRNNNATERALNPHRQGAKMSYSSASTITVTSGGIVCSNAAGTDREFRYNSANITVGWGNLSEGSEANSETYYCYANCDANATTFTGNFSSSSSAPTGVSNFVYLGSFVNDASGDITDISNADYPLHIYDSGWFAVTKATSYSKTHNLGTMQMGITLLFSASSDGSNAQEVNYNFDDLIGQRGGSVANITVSTFNVHTANDGVFVGPVQGAGYLPESGYYRVIAERLE